MSQSLAQNILHIVFSTKHRQPLIYPPYEDRLHSYLGGICNKMGCVPIKIGGYTDHVHLLCQLSKKIALMKLLEEVKSHSSKWMKTNDESLKNFYWQNARLYDKVGQGYGAFSVNPAETERVIAYIANQHEHHRQKDSRMNTGGF
jgi:putative transposase